MNKNRLRKIKEVKTGNVAFRVKRDMELTYTSNLEGAIDHLHMAHAHLHIHLDGKNILGLLTNISNANFEIRKHLKGELK